MIIQENVIVIQRKNKTKIGLSVSNQ